MEDDLEGIIDRDEYFPPSDEFMDDSEDYEDDEDDEDDEEMSEDDHDEDMGEPSGDWNAYLDRLCNLGMKALIYKITGDYENSGCFPGLRECPEFGKIKHISLGPDVLLPLIHRPKTRQAFLSAIESRGRLTLEKLYLGCIFVQGRRHDVDEVPMDLCRECFEELGSAFSRCDQLHTVDIVVHVDSADMDVPYSRLMDFLPQVKKVEFSIMNSDDRYVPGLLLQTFQTLPKLQDFELGEANSRTVQTCLRHLTQVPSLKRFVWQNNFPEFEKKAAVSDADVSELSRLLALNRLEQLELVCLNVSEPVPALAVCESIIASGQLKQVRLVSLVLGSVMNEFYGRLGQRLPEMKALESMTFFVGFERSAAGNAALSKEREVSEPCQLAILQGAARAPNLVDLNLPNCCWTDPLAATLKEYLSTTLILCRLEARGSNARINPTAIPDVKLALERCRLESLTCFLHDEDDVCTVASGVALNSSIQELSLSVKRISFDAVSRVCHELRRNQTVKHLVCGSQDFLAGPINGNELRAEEQPEAFERLENALASNVTLEQVHLGPYIQDDARLQAVVAIYTHLNQQGRRYIKQANEESNNFHQSAYTFLGQVNDSLDCVYTHLHDIPLLFDRR